MATIASKKHILGASCAAALFLSRYRPQYLASGSIMWTIIDAFTVSVVVKWVYEVVIHPKFVSPLRHLSKAPDSSLIFGNFWRIFNEPTGVPQQDWIDTVPNDGLIYYANLFNNPRVMPTSPEALKEVLSLKHYEFIKPRQFSINIGRILGIGLLLAEGDEHRRQRRDFMPAFAYRHIKNLYPTFWQQTRNLILALDGAIAQKRATSGNSERPVIETSAWASRSTLDIIGVATMGKSFGAIDDEQNKLYKAYQRLFSPSKATRILGVIGTVLPTWLLRALPVKRNNDLKESARLIKQIALDMVLEKKEKRSKGEASGLDILSVAMDSGNFSDENLVNQLMTFLAAGHETTASSLTWAIVLLCQHPEIQSRLRKELQAANLPDIRDPDSTVTAEILDRIPYLNAVCSEVLRFIPPVSLTLRESPNDATILGRLIPANTTIVLCPSAINHSKALWGPDASQFKPDRWLDISQENGSGSKIHANNTGGADNAYAFMSFLHGPRGCIGQGFSRAEFSCLLAGWVSSFETKMMDKDRKIEIHTGITQRPKDGFPVVLTPLHA